ncbi:MAG: type II toxin-antitoxin system VapC family toxin [Candidatus Jordarchaeales archaeon]
MRGDVVAEYLLDASALLPLILQLGHEVFDHVSRLVALTLTPYEVGNALWKEALTGRVRRVEPVAQLLHEFLKSIKLLDVRDSWTRVVELAVEEKLTFYDAAYIYVSRVEKLILVSEDADLLKRGAIKTSELVEKLRGTQL